MQTEASVRSKSLYIQVGDVLYEVNEKNVYCMNPELIGGLLLGYEGTQVSKSQAVNLFQILKSSFF